MSAQSFSENRGLSPFEYLTQVPSAIKNVSHRNVLRSTEEERTKPVIVYGRSTFYFNKTKAMVSCKRFVRTT